MVMCTYLLIPCEAEYIILNLAVNIQEKVKKNNFKKIAVVAR